MRGDPPLRWLVGREIGEIFGRCRGDIGEIYGRDEGEMGVR